MSEEKKTDASEQPQFPQGAQQQTRLQIDDAGAVTRYANFFLVTAGPEEVLLLFGLRSADGARARIEERIAVTPANAKRILLALSQSLKRYEDAFGTIDITPKTQMRPPMTKPGGVE